MSATIIMIIFSITRKKVTNTYSMHRNEEADRSDQGIILFKIFSPNESRLLTVFWVPQFRTLSAEQTPASAKIVLPETVKCHIVLIFKKRRNRPVK